MNYRPLNAEERSAPTPLRTVGLNQTKVARILVQHPAASGLDERQREE